MIYMALYTSLLYNTAPIHCTPFRLHPPVMNTQSGEWRPCWQKPCWQICTHGLHGHVGASALLAPLGAYGLFSKRTHKCSPASIELSSSYFCKHDRVVLVVVGVVDVLELDPVGHTGLLARPSNLGPVPTSSRPRIYIYIYICVCMCTCMYVYTYIYVYIYIYTYIILVLVIIVKWY